MSDVKLKQGMPPPHSLCIPPTEAAKQLGISRTKMYQLLHEGVVPSIRLGRKILIPTAELINWLHEQSTSNPRKKGGDANGNQTKASQ